MALTAAHIDQHLLARRHICRSFKPPFCRLRRFLQGAKIRREIGRVLLAELSLGERRHDTPRLVHCARDLCAVQSAAREIRAKSAFALWAMAVSALVQITGPVSLAALSVPC